MRNTVDMTIFKKIFGSFMRHIIRLNAGKEIKSFSELFINKIFEYTFVTFEYEQTIQSATPYYITFQMNKCCYSRIKKIWFLDDIWENLPQCIMAEFYWPQAIPCLCTHEKLSKVYWTRLYTLVRFSSKFKFQVWILVQLWPKMDFDLFSRNIVLQILEYVFKKIVLLNNSIFSIKNNI